jgi:hypothetical protein
MIIIGSAGSTTALEFEARSLEGARKNRESWISQSDSIHLNRSQDCLRDGNPHRRDGAAASVLAVGATASFPALSSEISRFRNAVAEQEQVKCYPTSSAWP